MAGKRIFFVDKGLLEAMYQDMTLKQIAEHFGVGETVIHKRIHEYGIKLRGYEEKPRTRPKSLTPEHIEALRKAGKKRRGKYCGQKNHGWKGGATAANLELRRSGAYKEWKFRSLELAGFKCQSCGAEKGSICKCCGNKTALHVHHVKGFMTYPELRFDPKNSEVLCVKCHHARHFGKLGEVGEPPII